MSGQVIVIHIQKNVRRIASEASRIQDRAIVQCNVLLAFVAVANADQANCVHQSLAPTRTWDVLRPRQGLLPGGAGGAGGSTGFKPLTATPSRTLVSRKQAKH